MSIPTARYGWADKGLFEYPHALGPEDKLPGPFARQSGHRQAVAEILPLKLVQGRMIELDFYQTFK